MDNYLKTNYDLNDKETVSVIDELPLWSAPFGLKLLDKIKYQKDITALDIGSGLGFPLLEIAMRLGNSCKLYGIDPWEAAVERIKTKTKIYGINNVEIITGVAENIPLPDHSVDLIFSNNGLNNVNDIMVFLKYFNGFQTVIDLQNIMSQFLQHFNSHFPVHDIVFHQHDAMFFHIHDPGFLCLPDAETGDKGFCRPRHPCFRQTDHGS